MRRLVGLLFFVGCHHAHAPTDGAPSATPSVLPSVSSAAPATPTTPVGLSTFALPPAAAVAKNDHGVTLLAAGKPTDAIAELEGALALAPDFVLARYNLACAHARANAFDAAERELTAVFEVDFVGMRAHASEDSDLAAFWKSPEGARLTAQIPSYEARYRAVIDRGVRAILWRAGAGTRGRLKPSLLRVGVWDSATKRFIAVAPPSRSAIFGFSASLAPYAVLATGTVRDMLGGDLDTGKNLERVIIYPVSTAGVPVATFKVDADPQQATLSLGATGATLYVFSSIGVGSPDRTSVLFDLPAWGSPMTTKTVTSSARARVKLSHERPVWIEVGYNHWGDLAHESDAADAPRVVPSPTGDRVAQVWDAATLQCDGSKVPGHFKMSLVDTSTKNVTSLGEGDGAAAVAFTKSGTMFVQRGSRVAEIAPKGELPLPENVRLVPDLVRDDECGF